MYDSGLLEAGEPVPAEIIARHGKRHSFPLQPSVGISIGTGKVRRITGHIGPDRE
jgi:hypothetical protein